MNKLMLITSVLFVAVSASAKKSSSQSVMKDFKYTSCAKTECVQVKSQRAWLSVTQGGFITDEGSVVEITDSKGNHLRTINANTVSYNVGIESLAIEDIDNNLTVYSLRTGESDSYRGSK